MGVAGALRAAGAEVEIPVIHDVRVMFDEWLLSEPAEDSDDIILKRALGLREV